MDKETALRKIEKCLALSKSSEPHEAARALQQAQALMRQFDIEYPELLAAGVTQEWSKSKSVKKPSDYEVTLATIVAAAFGCVLVFDRKWHINKLVGGYLFIGAGTSSKIASYTFFVLAKKLAQARILYTKEKLKRYRKNKVAAADMFCNGWVLAVSAYVNRTENSPERQSSIDAYMSLNFSGLVNLDTKKRELVNMEKNSEHRHNGWIEGKKVQIHDAISSQHEAAPMISA